MMAQRLLADAWRMLWPLLIAAAISYSISQWWPLVVVLALQLSWQVWQKWRLAHWLIRGELFEPFYAGGLWEDYYTRLMQDRKSTRLNSSHVRISYAVFCLKKKKTQ